jgi:hypothetical protein
MIRTLQKKSRSRTRGGGGTPPPPSPSFDQSGGHPPPHGPGQVGGTPSSLSKKGDYPPSGSRYQNVYFAWSDPDLASACRRVRAKDPARYEQLKEKDPGSLWRTRSRTKPLLPPLKGLGGCEVNPVTFFPHAGIVNGNV